MTHAAEVISRESDTAIGSRTIVGFVGDDVHVADETPAPAGPTALDIRHRKTVRRVMGAALVVLAVLTAAVVTVGYRNLSANIADGEEITHNADAPNDIDDPNRALNILIMGSDSRDGKGNNIDGGAGGGERSDTTILLHVAANRKSAYGVSLPRDAIVDRPDCKIKGKTVEGEKQAMFNTAFSVGGPQCTIQTVESLTGVYIDHFIVLDFNGFKDMVDAVNGVEVCIPKKVEDPDHDIYFDAGTQVLTGDQALNYVRERYVLSVTGDIGRMRRQQAFIGSMVNKVMSAGTLSRPDRIYSFLNAVTGSIKVDAELDTVPKLVDFSSQFKDIGLKRIKFVTVPIGPYEPDPNRLIWTADADRLWKRIIADDPLGQEFSKDSLDAEDPVKGDPGGGPGDGVPPGAAAAGEGADDDGADAEERLANGLCA